MKDLSEPDRPWCPECGEPRFDYRVEDGDCEECGEPVQDEWPQWPLAKHIFGNALALGVIAVLFLGPPVVVLYRLLQGGHLIVSRQVTRVETYTVYHGILPDVVPFVLIWVGVLLFARMIIDPPMRRF